MDSLCIHLSSFPGGLSTAARLGKEVVPFFAEVFFERKLPRIGLIFGRLLGTLLVFMSNYVYWRGAEIQRKPYACLSRLSDQQFTCAHQLCFSSQKDRIFDPSHKNPDNMWFLLINIASYSLILFPKPAPS